MRMRQMFWNVGTTAAIAAAVAIGAPVPQARAQVEQTKQEDVQRKQGDVTDRAAAASDDCKASEVIGMAVRGLSGDDKIGSINDLLIDHDGRVKYAAVSFGGFLGFGNKLFAVPIESIDFVKSDNDVYVRIDATEETLKAKLGFDQDNWPTEPDRTFATSKLRGQLPQVDAQGEPRLPDGQRRTGDRANRATASNDCKASDMIGMAVRGLTGDDKIGSINDLVLDHDGRVKYVAVSFGGFLGFGNKLFAVPTESIEFVKVDKDAYARIDATEKTLEGKAGFDQDNWPTEPDRTFTKSSPRVRAVNPATSR